MPYLEKKHKLGLAAKLDKIPQKHHEHILNLAS